MDAADHASDREAEFIEARLAEQQRTAGLDRLGAERCADCQEEIPMERRRAIPSAFRCLTCQAWVERVAKIPNTA
jgi:phage/conjugal plasmid C-4 type zinc finger TraR family protein